MGTEGTWPGVLQPHQCLHTSLPARHSPINISCLTLWPRQSSLGFHHCFLHFSGTSSACTNAPSLETLWSPTLAPEIFMGQCCPRKVLLSRGATTLSRDGGHYSGHPRDFCPLWAWWLVSLPLLSSALLSVVWRCWDSLCFEPPLQMRAEPSLVLLVPGINKPIIFIYFYKIYLYLNPHIANPQSTNLPQPHQHTKSWEMTPALCFSLAGRCWGRNKSFLP